MELSQYVVDAISSVKQFDVHRKFEVVSQLKQVASNAPNSDDAHALEIVSGTLSLMYNLKKQNFLPSIVFDDGRRSFAMEDIGPNDREILKKAANIVENIWIRAQMSHIVWLKSENYQFGQAAVAEYLKLFEELFDPLNWSECNEAVQCAFQIASKLGKKTESFVQTRTAINQKLSEMDGTDSGFLSISLLKLAIKDATTKELEAYLQIVTKLADKNICADNPNTSLADDSFSVQKLLLKQLKKEDDIKTATANYAKYYELLAESFVREGDCHRAVIMMKKACTLYGTLDREKLLALRSRLEELQKKALGCMSTIPFKYDMGSTFKLVDQLFDGLSLQETIVQLGYIAPICEIDDVKQQVLEKKKECVFSSLFSSSVLNENGQTVQHLPPLSNVDPEAQPDLFRKHMIRYASEQRGLFDSIVLEYAFEFLKNFGNFSESTLNFLVCNNVIVPANRAEIIKEGLYLGLTGRRYASMHILLPQTENLFRHLVKMCGDTVTFLNEDGTEAYKPLSALFKSDKLHECYDENIIFTFQSIMDEPIAENLRNLNAHGTLEPQIGDSAISLCFLCLLIRLLAMYGKESNQIWRKLAKRSSS